MVETRISMPGYRIGVHGINRVTYDITIRRPLGTIERE
jgi:GMP synthase PP-ATPase subunit